MRKPKQPAASTPEKKTPGTIAVEKYRPSMNKLTDAERERLLAKAVYPERTAGSVLAREARELANDLTDEECEAHFREAMTLIHAGGNPQQTPGAGH